MTTKKKSVAKRHAEPGMKMSETRVCQSCAKVGAALPILAMLDPLGLLTIFSGLLAAIKTQFATCFALPVAAVPPETVQEHVTAAYHEGNYDHEILGPTVRHALVQGRRTGCPVTRDQAREIAIVALDQVRTAEPVAVGEAMGAHAG